MTVRFAYLSAKIFEMHTYRNLRWLPALLLTALFSLPSFAQQDKDIETVRSILLRQAEDWNRGDIEGFMNGYWESDALQFVSSAGVTYGWRQTLERYRRRYPDREAMGTLHFEVLEVKKLSRKVIMLTGSYDLDGGEPDGHFLLVWKKIGGEWVIVADHTSAK